jgi:hypothetical protein
VLFPATTVTATPLMDEDMSEVPPSMVGVGGLGTLYSVGGEKILKAGLGYAGELEKVV